MWVEMGGDPGVTNDTISFLSVEFGSRRRKKCQEKKTPARGEEGKWSAPREPETSL